MYVGILGPLEVRDAAGQPVALAGPRLRALLVRLAVAGGQAVAAERLAEDLWPGGRPADAANALQALVSRLRQAAGRDVVEYQAGGYRLAVEPGHIDAVAFERLIGTARTVLADGDPARGAEILEEAAALWRGPALADAADAPFAAGPVARLEELRVAAAEDLIEARLALGRGAGLIPDIEELTASHPLRERLRGQLMRALYAAGRQADALAVYEETRRLLADRLGVDPSPELAAVHLAILRGDSSLSPWTSQPEPSPQPPAEPPRPAGLPAQITSFVGREDELERVAKQLGEARLVTLTGPGGAGKTRLAVEAAGRWSGQAPDGVWFVPLAPVRDALDLPAAVLTALGVTENLLLADAVDVARGVVADPPVDRLADFLAARQLVLVLDNCEHLIEAVARLATRILADAPGVRILATSRESLGLTGETLCPVPSLPLPPDDVPAAEALSYAAVRLFEDRAAAVRPGFSVGPAEAGPVVRICRALDGIPLAIELAAARLRSLTLTQVEARLGDRFRLLATGTRAAAERHQTLRAIVDWSWDLLDEDERTVLRRLSVFSGGATPDSAEQVCALGGASEGVIDLVASLVDKSLVVATGQAEVRYQLLETVRAYAGERLAEAGERDQVRAAHARHFLALAERAEPLLRSRDQLKWLDRLSAEHDNCSAALRYAVDSRDAEMGLRFVAALMWFWITLDYDAEGGAWASAVREVAGPSVPAGLADEYAICEFVAAVGTAASANRPRPGTGPEPAAPAGPSVTPPRDLPEREGSVNRLAVEPDGLTLLREALERAASLVSPDTKRPLLLLALPMTAMFSGDTSEARRRLASLSGHPDPWVRAAARAMCGHLAMNEGDVADAASDFEAGYAAFRSIGDRWGLIISLGGMAEVAMARDEPATAVQALEEARRYAVEGRSAHWGEMQLIPLGRARAAAGDLEAARADLERGARSAGRIGENDDEATGYLELSELARRGGDLAQARRRLEQAWSIAEPRAERMDVRMVAARACSKLGCLSEQEGDLDAAERWHQQAIGLLTGHDMSFLPINPTLAEVVEGFAALAAARGRPGRAAELLGLAHTLHGFRDTASLEVTRVLAAVTGAIGEEACAAAYERGRGLTRDDALALTP